MFLESLFILSLASAKEAPEVLDQIEHTRASILLDERQQREALSHLFDINKKVREISRHQEQLNQKMLSAEADVRALAQDVNGLQQRCEEQKQTLNRRLRRLYQEPDQNNFHWLFSAQSPVELERNHRYLKLMIDSDHRQLKNYLVGLEDLKRHRGELKKSVLRLASLQKQIKAQEKELALRMQQKSKFLNELNLSRETKLSALQGLRKNNSEVTEALSYAFFERKGALRPPIEGPVIRDYGAYVDPLYRFKVTHKGWFYSSPAKTEIKAVFGGVVAFAAAVPGFGQTLILDHGGNYYTLYAYASKLQVAAGSKVEEGDVLGLSGEASPLFGPGLYFEIRHFTDAVDPRPWIKDSVIKTAED